MTKRFVAILAALCFPIVTAVWAQTVSFAPIQVPAFWWNRYFVPAHGFPAGESGWFGFKDGIASGIYYTNVVGLPSRSFDIRYGDKIRLRTVGTARRDSVNPDGTPQSAVTIG